MPQSCMQMSILLRSSYRRVLISFIHQHQHHPCSQQLIRMTTANHVLPRLTLLLLLLSISARPCLSQSVIQIQHLTSDASDGAGTDDDVIVELINTDFDICITERLDIATNDYNDNERGIVDTYLDAVTLGACLGFPAPGGEIPLATVSISGGDSWTPEWIHIILDDGTWIDCPNPDLQLADNNNPLDLDCQKIAN